MAGQWLQPFEIDKGKCEFWLDEIAFDPSSKYSPESFQKNQQPENDPENNQGAIIDTFEKKFNHIYSEISGH